MEKLLIIEATTETGKDEVDELLKEGWTIKSITAGNQMVAVSSGNSSFRDSSEGSVYGFIVLESPDS